MVTGSANHAHSLRSAAEECTGDQINAENLVRPSPNVASLLPLNSSTLSHTIYKAIYNFYRKVLTLTSISFSELVKHSPYYKERIPKLLQDN